MLRVKSGSGVRWALLVALWIGVGLNCVAARKWNTNKDSIIIDAVFEDDEEGELHFDALEQPDNVECLTLDQEPGVCVTLRRCHPILFGEKGELRNPSLAEEYSKNVDACQGQNSEVEGDEVHFDDEGEGVKPQPVPVPTKSSIADRILCCAKEKVQIAHRSSLEASEEEMATFHDQTTTVPPSPVVPLKDSTAEKVEELLVLDTEAPSEQPQSSVGDDSSGVGITGRPEVEEVVHQTQVQDQGQSEGGAEGVGVTSVPVQEDQKPSQPPQASSSPVPLVVEDVAPVQVQTPEEPAVEVPVPAEEAPAQSVGDEHVQQPSVPVNDACPAVTVYNTWPSFDSYPFLAAIQTRSNSGPICSGSLIDARHIITAAHCLHRFNSKDVARMQVRLGFTKNPFNDTFNDFHLERKATKIILHKRFHEQSKMDNNIALVQLDEPIEFDSQVAPISIFNGARGFDQGQCAGVEPGWIKYGNRKVTGISEGVIHYIEPPMSDFVLREAINKIYTNSECQTHLYSEITEDMLCAKTEMFEARGVNNDHFRGNDGGPLILRVGREGTQQVGIKSWAYEGNQYPTVYTRIDRYLDWIQDNLQM